MTVPAELDERFRAAAAAEDLDAAYDLMDSPVGPLLVGATDRGLCLIAFDPDEDLELDGLAARFGRRVLRAPRKLDPAKRQLDEYFGGKRRAFDLDADVAALPVFQRRVLEELGRVGYAETTAYGGLATRIGAPRAARAVGGALNRNPIPIVLPCHRVVGAGGRLVGYAGGLERKRALLSLEGVSV